MHRRQVDDAPADETMDTLVTNTQHIVGVMVKLQEVPSPLCVRCAGREASDGRRAMLWGASGRVLARRWVCGCHVTLFLNVGGTSERVVGSAVGFSPW